MSALTAGFSVGVNVSAEMQRDDLLAPLAGNQSKRHCFRVAPTGLAVQADEVRDWHEPG